MPDIAVRAHGQPTTLHTVLRAGRHVLVVPAASLVTVLDEAGLRPTGTILTSLRPTAPAGRAGPPGRPVAAQGGPAA